ncbi:MAG: hypothetical protein IIV13_03235 [Bacteroidaceae bacterium]|nr:hypothetical protein [Bacteroidaceae bacterium]
MDIHEKIIKIITVIREAGQGLTRDQLQNILVGNRTEELQQIGLDNLESFGIAENTDEEDWNAIIDQSIKDGFLKIKNQKQNTLTYTPEGKKFCKKPRPITVKGEGEEESYGGVGGSELDAVMRGALMGRQNKESKHVTERSKLQIKLIQAVDRKIALDVFAENENVDLDEVLDELESLLRHSKRLDITYFTNEVIGKEDIEEIRDSFAGSKISMEALRQDWGDVYNEEELRLLFYILS